jgi:hypothetical protein
MEPQLGPQTICLSSEHAEQDRSHENEGGQYGQHVDPLGEIQVSLSWVVEPAMEATVIGAGGKQQLLCAAAQISGFRTPTGFMSLSRHAVSRRGLI